MHTLTSKVTENDNVYNRGLGGEIISAGDNYYAYNGHGDTTNLTKQSSGVALAITANYEYDAFGNCLATGGEADSNPFRYNEQYVDSETGLIYLRNRYYDPSIGRFTQEDPAKDGLNWYVYCGNDPVNYMDLWGTTMTLLGEGGDVRRIFDNIQSLTDDELVFSYKTPSVVVLNDNNGEFDEYAVEEMPLNILIGHELIHALRGMDGNFKSNYFRDHKAGVNYEEYEVTGISYYD